MKPCAATIVSANYLAYAKVFAESVHLHFPEAHVVALIVDRRLPALEALTRDLPFEVVWAEDLGLADFERLAYQFDILELNTCLKPTFLKRLLSQGYDCVVYFDPDIRLFAEPTPVLEVLEHSSIVLTPHTIKPMMDGHRPSDLDLLRAGSYNLGFIALRNDANAHALLDWWEDRCLTYGFNDPALATFVDQKWLDLAPSYFDGVHLLKHRGCNVAYWNLHEREITRVDHGWRAGSDALVFFHFSGVNASSPRTLSKYQDRHDLVPGGSVSVLVEEYCAALLLAGHATLQNIPYSFASLSDGAPVTPLMRRAFGVLGENERLPFDAESAMQRALIAARIASPLPARGARPAASSRALSLNPADRRLIWTNRLLRVLCRMVGVDRVQLLIRYATFLSRGSNLPAVLSQQPFRLSHDARRPGGSADRPTD